MTAIKLPNVSSKYGAPIGRPTRATTKAGPVTLRLQKVSLSQGYDSGGAYWGNRPTGFALYYYWWQSPTHNRADIVSGFIDAKSRDHAKTIIKQEYPEATFFQ